MEEVNQTVTPSTKVKKKFELISGESKNGIPYGNIVYIIAFCVPLIMFIALYMVRGIYPFGDSCYLRTDMYHQYAPFFEEFFDKLRSGGSLTYSWNTGLGTNFTALYAYYLASPINWLVFLAPRGYMIEVMNIIIILKLSLASVAFTYYITKHFNIKNCTIAVFGTFYAMSGYVAAYNWNIMWLDCIVLVPIIMLGLERLVNKNKPLLYCISLGICIFSNYYISIMVCITSVIYFVILLISYDGPKSVKIYLMKLLRFGVYSLLAGGVAACVLLPEMYALSLSASSTVSFPNILTSYFPILDMIARHMIDIPVHMGLEHYPNIYCGVAVLFLLPLYIMNKNINTRQKAGKICLLLIFLLAFNLNIPNFVWHGLHFPNSLPARQSFIYIFFLLAMCYEAFKDIKKYSDKQITGALWIVIALLLICDQIYFNGQYKFTVFYISGAFVLVYALIAYLYRRKTFNSTIILFLLFVVSIIECTLNMESTGLSVTNRTGYTSDNAAITKLVDEAAKSDTSKFYRTEKLIGTRTKNDGAWSNYNSVSSFSSVANAGVTELLKSMGCEGSTNAYSSKGSTALTYSMFSVKYLLSSQAVETGVSLTPAGNYNGEYLYKNEYTLPIGYMVSQNINDYWMTSNYNPFEVQNSFVQVNTGIEDMFQIEKAFPGESSVMFDADISAHYYAFVNTTAVESIQVSVGSIASTLFTGLKNTYIVDIGYAKAGESISLTADSNMNLTIYTLNEYKFKQFYDKMSTGGINLTEFSDTHIEGTFNASSNGLMMLSIPFDKGWTVKIDGKKTDITAIKDALIGVEVSSGNHTIELSYTPVGLVKGIIISIICVITIIAIAVLVYMNKWQVVLSYINKRKQPLDKKEL